MRRSRVCSAPLRAAPHPGNERKRHEHPRIPGESGVAGIRRAGAARPAGLHCRRSGEGRQRSRRAGLGGEGANPCRRPRQGRRRQSGQIDRRRAARGRAAVGLDAGDAPDRAARQRGAPPLHRGRLRRSTANTISRPWSTAPPRASPSSPRPKAAWRSKRSPAPSRKKFCRSPSIRRPASCPITCGRCRARSGSAAKWRSRPRPCCRSSIRRSSPRT